MEPVKKGNKTVGHVEMKNRVYFTKRTPETFVKKYQGFGVSVDVIEKLKAEGVNNVVIKYEGDETKVYEAKTQKFLDEGTRDRLGGYDEQVFLSTDQLDEVKKPKTNTQNDLSAYTG